MTKRDKIDHYLTELRRLIVKYTSTFQIPPSVVERINFIIQTLSDFGLDGGGVF